MERCCVTCKQVKILDDFYKKDRTHYRSDCKECHRKVMRPRSAAHYRANKAKYLRRNRKRAREIAALLRDYKSAHSFCTDCGLSHPYYRLDFDHIQGHTKRFVLSDAASARWSDQRIFDEIAKCELVCANCHRDRTYARTRGDLNA